MNKSVCYIKIDNNRLSINAIYKGEDVWDLIEQKINELSGKDILVNISFPEGTQIDLDGYTNRIREYLTSLPSENYKVNGEIIESDERPKIGYSVYNGYHVQITDYDGDDIFNSLEKHKKLYPYVSSKSRKINKL